MPEPLDVLGPALALGGGVAYVIAAGRTYAWPVRRTLAWLAGSGAALGAVTGPLAETAEHDFAAHAVAHVLLGMLAPLLLCLAAPVTLTLRVLPVRHGRRLVRLLRTTFVRTVTEPAVAAVLDVGGLWLLYRTSLYAHSTHHPALHVLVHVHVLLAGYLFSVALVGRDPMPHRRPYAHRAVVLVLALAAHGILAKTLYADPLAGVPLEQARLGAMLMYYGGDIVELGLAVLLCAAWYRGARSLRPSRQGLRARTARRWPAGRGAPREWAR